MFKKHKQLPELVFETEIRLLKHPSPGLSHFCTSLPVPLFGCLTYTLPSSIPKCLSTISMQDTSVQAAPLSTDTSLRMLYIAILTIALDNNINNPSAQSSLEVLRRLKKEAYNESLALTILPAAEIQADFLKYYEDGQFRKLLVEFFHLVPAQQHPNRVLRFIEKHRIMDLIFRLLFKRVIMTVSGKSEHQKITTAQMIDILFQHFQIPKTIANNRLLLPNGFSIAEDSHCTYLLYPKSYEKNTHTDMDSDSDSDSSNEDLSIDSRMFMTSDSKEIDATCDESKFGILDTDRKNNISIFVPRPQKPHDPVEFTPTTATPPTVESILMTKKIPTKEEFKSYLSANALSTPMLPKSSKTLNEKNTDKPTGGIVQSTFQFPLTFNQNAMTRQSSSKDSRAQMNKYSSSKALFTTYYPPKQEGDHKYESILSPVTSRYKKAEPAKIDSASKEIERRTSLQMEDSKTTSSSSQLGNSNVTLTSRESIEGRLSLQKFDSQTGLLKSKPAITVRKH